MPTSLPDGIDAGTLSVWPTSPKAATSSILGMLAASSGVRPFRPSCGSSATPSGMTRANFMRQSEQEVLRGIKSGERYNVPCVRPEMSQASGAARREPSAASFLYRQADACRSPILSLMTAWSINKQGSSSNLTMLILQRRHRSAFLPVRLHPAADVPFFLVLLSCNSYAANAGARRSELALSHADQLRCRQTHAFS